MIYSGDSGGPSFIERDGEKFLIGVHSWSFEPSWGAVSSDVWVGGQGTRDWLKANMDSETPISSKDFGCEQWASTETFGTNASSFRGNSDYFECDCDCDSDDDQCEQECEECLAASNSRVSLL